MITVWLFRFPLALFTRIVKVTTLVNCLNSVWIALWDRTKVGIQGKSREFSLVSCLSSKWRWIGEKSVKGEPNYETCKLFDYCLESIKGPQVRVQGKALHLSLISCLSSKWRWMGVESMNSFHWYDAFFVYKLTCYRVTSSPTSRWRWIGKKNQWEINYYFVIYMRGNIFFIWICTIVQKRRKLRKSSYPTGSLHYAIRTDIFGRGGLSWTKRVSKFSFL